MGELLQSEFMQRKIQISPHMNKNVHIYGDERGLIQPRQNSTRVKSKILRGEARKKIKRANKK